MGKLLSFNKQLSDTDKQLLSVEETLTKIVKTYKMVIDETIALNEQLNKNEQSHTKVNEAVKKTNNNLDVLAQAQLEEEKMQKQLTQTLARARAERSDEGKELARARHLRTEQNKKIKEEIKLQGAEVNSIARLRAENKKLRQERDKVNTSTEEGKAKIEELNAAIDENDQIIRDNTDSLVQQKIGIGDYQSVWDAMPDSLQNVQGGIQGVGQQLKILLANPVVAVFAAIAAAAIAIGKAMTSSRDGMNAFQKRLNGVRADIDIAKKQFREFANSIRENFSKEGISKAIDNVKKGFKDFKDEMKEKGIFTALKNEIKDEIEVGKQAAQNFRDQSNALKAVKDELLSVRDAYIDIENESKIRIANLQSESDLLQIAADDDSQSMKQMLEARERLTQVEVQRTQEIARLANERLKISELEIKEAILAGDIRKTAEGELISITKDGIEIEQAYSDAKIEAIEASNEVLRVETENAQKRRLTELDVFEQRLDLLLDIADATKTVNEQIIGDTELSLTARNDLLKETQQIMQESFDQQIKLFENQEGISLDVNKLLTLNNNEIIAYAESLDMSERATNRLREVIVERKKAQQDLAQAEKDLNREANERLVAAEEGIQEIERQRLLRTEQNLEKRKELEIQFEQENRDRLLENDALTAEERLLIEQEFQEAKFKIEEDYSKQSIELEKKKTDEQSKIREQAVNYANQIINEGFNFFQQSLNNELAVLENRYQRDIELAGDNTAKKEQIDKTYAAERNRIERQRAITDKAQGVFNAIINTSVAVTKALVTSPLLAVLIGALGAAQIATILAQPVPKFAHGEMKGLKKDTYAEFGEEGREIISLPSGKNYVAESKTRALLPKGTKIIPNRETEKILSETGGMSVDKWNELLDATKSKSQSQPVYQSNINGDKFHRSVAYGNNRIKFDNEYFGH